MELLRTQKNQFFFEIERAGLNPADFHWANLPDQKLSLEIKHTPSNYFFKFGFDVVFMLYFSPGDAQVYESHSVYKWEGVWSGLRAWLSYLKREHLSPDLWGQAAKERAFVDAAISPSQKAVFTGDEKSLIAKQLQELREFLFKTATLTEEHKKLIESRLQYLVEASERQERNDWVNTAIGVLFTIVIGVALSPDAARELYRLAGNLFSKLLAGIPLLP